MLDNLKNFIINFYYLMKATNINIDIRYIHEYLYKFSYQYFIDTDFLNIGETWHTPT